MKNIVVAIDFSKGSIHALNYAIDVANRAGANIHMIWVDNISTEEIVYSHFTNEDRLEHKKNFQKLSKKITPKLKDGKLQHYLRKGKVHLEISKLAAQKNADLIIAGTHGITGFEEYWIGSNAYRIVTYAPCPVITLRQDFNFKNGIRNIVFPVDSTIETKQKLPFTVEFAKMFDASIHLLGLYSTSLKTVQKRIDTHLEHAANYLKENNVSFIEERTKPDNITRFIREYAKNQKAELITIMTEQEGTKANVFLGPNAEQLISHSHIPILSLRPKSISNKN
ncbi:MAG: universal stress protein [Bacteroidales bacterium]|nr:universal stress protein [Bacteroidales bacterium]MCF8388362.1 universal stress protein [Bacteroidales bacterium]MCF8397269.1 universal stress protein [Bacteroidales bacterium]